MSARYLLPVLLLLSATATAQTINDGVVDVPLSLPEKRSGVVPTTLLPHGALRFEGGGVRLPGEPQSVPPVAATPMPSIDNIGPDMRAAPSLPPTSPAARSGQRPVPPATSTTTSPAASTECVGALAAPLQVQLGAVEGRSAADKEADRLMRRYGQILGARPTPTDCAAPRPNVFRLRLAVPSPAEGHRVCNELASRGERCLIVRGN
jgi:hypothetical protein